jgi:undecaprenyl diphosphate synthase
MPGSVLQEISALAPDTGVPPCHVAIIMDGNGRWAKARGLPRIEGHRRGVEALRRAVRTAIDLKIAFLTVYSFSAENWTRPFEEVQSLMGLLHLFIRNDLADLNANNVRIRVIGARDGLPSDIVGLLEEAESVTQKNTGLVLIVAFNYGGRQEIAAAARALAVKVAKGDLAPDRIDVDSFGAALDTAEFPDPDLVIRTSGEKRISNFLLWQAAYAEFVFLDVLWPDFGKLDFIAALEEYAHRDRRYGGVKSTRAIKTAS